MGSSLPGSTTRQSTSAQIRKMAPSRADRGISFLWSVPNTIRTTWGMSRPTKPISPALYTTNPTSRADTSR